MDLKLNYLKEDLVNLPILHRPCTMCMQHEETREEVEKMQADVNSAGAFERSIATLYHFMVHFTEAGKNLFWTDREKLV